VISTRGGVAFAALEHFRTVRKDRRLQKQALVTGDVAHSVFTLKHAYSHLFADELEDLADKMDQERTRRRLYADFCGPTAS
jgi:hypothetical protein